MNWETVLRTKNQKEATKMVNKLAETRKLFGESFDKFAIDIGYHYTNIWVGDKELSPHMRRVLVELKILALTGQTFFKV